MQDLYNVLNPRQWVEKGNKNILGRNIENYMMEAKITDKFGVVANY